MVGSFFFFLSSARVSLFPTVLPQFQTLSRLRAAGGRRSQPLVSVGTARTGKVT